ncbi:MAG: hypothetical protein JXR37_15125 [Kiritimatiellae bacterium]|nr:hypothetical protein [Kiritimatiellia bacterium]
MEKWLTFGVAVAFLIACLSAVWRQSFIAIDGQRYFTIADDALITLRYGWNLAHGRGLVWNAGERVEGITNPLWALQAASLSFFLGKRFLPLGMQLSSILYLLLTAYGFQCLLRQRLPARQGKLATTVLTTLAFLIPLSYPALVSWSLRGMETSLQSALTACAVVSFVRHRDRPAWAGSICLGLACLTRPDCVVSAGVIFGFRASCACRNPLRFRQLLKEAVPFVVLVCSASVFRYVYYHGSLVPNTAILKLQGMSAVQRIRLNGIGYILPFLKMSWPLVALVAFSLVFNFDQDKLLLAAIPCAMTAYVVYVGGDAFGDWRFLAPYVPYAFVVLLLDFPFVDFLAGRLLAGSVCRNVVRGGLLILLGVVLLTVSRPSPCWSGFCRFRGPQRDNIAQINTAVFLDRVLAADASVGVFYAGAIPFYTGRYAVDFLGKSDPYVARLPPDISGAVSWRAGISMPGHNKYDLAYSILRRRPTYIEGMRWGAQDITEQALRHYTAVPVDFGTWSSYDNHAVLLLKGAPCVKWHLIGDVTAEGNAPPASALPSGSTRLHRR